jgi:hypothetical protein
MNGRWAESFYAKYRDDPDWKAADAFLCFHPAATCELFLLFNKPIIVWTTIRIDNGRMLDSTRRNWLETLRTQIAVDKRSVIAANNRYDVEYTRFFTGVDSVLLPSYCGYVRHTYNPTRAGFLVYRPLRANDFTQIFMDSWNKTCRRMGLNASHSVQLTPVQVLYTDHRLDDLTAHRGIVNLPVQPSMMSIFEQYRMNIPLFFPSLELLIGWHLNYTILSEVDIFVGPSTSFEPFHSQRHIPHPYRMERTSAEYWLKLADWYSLPYVFYYNSIEDLASLLNNLTDAKLRRVSDKMRVYNDQFRQELISNWTSVLKRVAGEGRLAL